jgi:hypothetical protein
MHARDDFVAIGKEAADHGMPMVRAFRDRWIVGECLHDVTIATILEG